MREAAQATPHTLANSHYNHACPACQPQPRRQRRSPTPAPVLRAFGPFPSSAAASATVAASLLAPSGVRPPETILFTVEPITITSQGITYRTERTTLPAVPIPGLQTSPPPEPSQPDEPNLSLAAKVFQLLTALDPDNRLRKAPPIKVFLLRFRQNARVRNCPHLPLWEVPGGAPASHNPAKAPLETTAAPATVGPCGGHAGRRQRFPGQEHLP